MALYCCINKRIYVSTRRFCTANINKSLVSIDTIFEKFFCCRCCCQSFGFNESKQWQATLQKTKAPTCAMVISGNNKCDAITAQQRISNAPNGNNTLCYKRNIPMYVRYVHSSSIWFFVGEKCAESHMNHIHMEFGPHYK